MIVPMMTGLRVEVRKETQLKRLAEAVNAQTLTRISIVKIETVGQLVVLDTVHLIAFGLFCCSAASKTIDMENLVNQAARLFRPADSLRFSLIDQFLLV